MRPLTGKTRAGSYIVFFALCFFLILLAACGSGSSTSDGASSDAGSIAFSLVWEGTTDDRSAIHQAAKFDCAGNGVDTVQADIYDGDNPLQSGDPWDCVDGTGTIEDVQAGSNRRVVVFGLDSNGDVLYQGGQSGITVTAGQTTQVQITMNYVGDTLIWDHRNWDEANWG